MPPKKFQVKASGKLGSDRRNQCNRSCRSTYRWLQSRRPGPGHRPVRCCRLRTKGWADSPLSFPGETYTNVRVEIGRSRKCDRVTRPGGITATTRGLGHVADDGPGGAVVVFNQRVVRSAIAVLDVEERQHDVVLAAAIDDRRLARFSVSTAFLKSTRIVECAAVFPRDK